MGNTQAYGYRDAVAEGLIPLEVALSAHFSSNHYPPLPQALIPVAVQAICAANAGDWDDELELPAGITWRGETAAPVGACVASWHLEAFLDDVDLF